MFSTCVHARERERERKKEVCGFCFIAFAFARFCLLALCKLANISETLEQENTEVVSAFYGAIALGDAKGVQGLLASDDLE